jgi:hypothetical protein
LQWNSICLELPHCALKLICSGMVQELKRQNRHIPALSIASAINERLNCLLPTFSSEGVPADRALMFSEAARRDTFIKWPHMNYKYVVGWFRCIMRMIEFVYFFCVHVEFIAFNTDCTLGEQSTYCRLFLFGKSLI